MQGPLGLPFRCVPVTLINEFAPTLSLRRNTLPMLLDVFRPRLRDRLERPLPTPQFVFAEAGAASEDDYKRLAD